MLDDIRGFVNSFFDTDALDSLLARTAEMIERHSILLWVNRILNPILETEVSASIGVAFQQTILDAFAEIQQNLGNLVSPPVIGYVVGYGIKHWLRFSCGQLSVQREELEDGKDGCVAI